jgi:hypothetical protein
MIIFLDLDGVIIDICKGVCDWFDLPYAPELVTHWDSFPELTNIDPEYFWHKLRVSKFWKDLTFYPNAISFMAKLSLYGQVVLLTSPANGCAGYRQNWIEKNLSSFFQQGHYILTPAKWACAHKDTILIDDSSDNCKEFVAAGGRALLYPQPWNSKNVLPEEKKNEMIIKALKRYDNENAVRKI